VSPTLANNMTKKRVLICLICFFYDLSNSPRAPHGPSHDVLPVCSLVPLSGILRPSSPSAATAIGSSIALIHGGPKVHSRSPTPRAESGRHTEQPSCHSHTGVISLSLAS
jgi:hypothetical protein